MLDTGTAARSFDVAVADSFGPVAVRLLTWAREAGSNGLIHVASSERRAERLARILRSLAPNLETIVFPPWDCLPYDRASPSRTAMGRRTAALRALAQADAAPRLVIATPDALIQRVPPRDVWADAAYRLTRGDALDIPTFTSFLHRAGYALEERVDEAGEAAIRGGVIDVFPAGAAAPVRIEHSDDRIVEIRTFDPLTQRTIGDVEALDLDPASEVILPAPNEDEAEAPRSDGMEHGLPDFYPHLESLFDYLPHAPVVLDHRADGRLSAVIEQIADAYDSRAALPADGPCPEPARLYLDEAEWSARLAERPMTRMTHSEEPRGVPGFATASNPAGAFAAFVRDSLAQGRRVVLAAAADRDARALSQRAAQRLGRTPEPADDWSAVRAAPAGALLTMRLDLEEGFFDAGDEVVVVAAADLLGSRAATDDSDAPPPSSLLIGEVGFRLGDAIIHFDHGMAALKGLETVAVAEAHVSDMIRLDYAAGAKLMAPIDQIDRIWRYGSEVEAVSLDRLDGEGWAKRRTGVQAEIQETAERLVEMARAREATEAPVLKPPPRDYERFVRRFRFTETRDQARAVEDALRDLASGRPMDRLVCGDVGFGKTEVALRAVAATLLAGKQAALAAPTTVLARQHMKTFSRRFAGFGFEIAQLSRLVTPAEAKAVKEGLADGRIRLVIGTHALAAKGVRFHDLGLLVIDEEQRFGAAQKASLRALGRGVHTLTLTATPIPRTLQAAMIGLQDLSVIATPPARRQPIRTFVAPFDPVAARQALMREKRRGGQSFVVCPRIEDIAPMAALLGDLVPELKVTAAHGRLPPADIDDVMTRFADGEGDILLATNIIESGLDVPRANTILIWRADRFGLAQLHQLRGRVGRGARRAIAYLLIDPEAKLAAATRKRLDALETLDRLGSGFAISARDLDLRGAGDLLGQEQAGHVKLIGINLYQHLLEQALKAARGEEAEEDWTPEINIGAAGLIPESYVSEPEIRIDLYVQAAKLRSADDIDALTEEINDRFGPMPDEVRSLLGLARLRRLCRAAGVAKLDAGPLAIAFSFRAEAEERPDVRAAMEASADAFEWRGERLICRRETETPEERERLAVEFLEKLQTPAHRRRQAVRSLLSLTQTDQGESA